MIYELKLIPGILTRVSVPNKTFLKDGKGVFGKKKTPVSVLGMLVYFG